MARLTQIQIPNRTVPLDQIVAVQGQNPIATGVQDLGNDLGQAITRRNQLLMQGQQLAYLAKQAGTDAPPIGTDPTLFEKSLNYKALAQQRQADAANQRVNEQLALEKLRRGYSEVDPTTGKTRYFPGVQGLSIGTDANGNPTVIRDPSYNPGQQPVLRGVNGGASANNNLWYKFQKDQNPNTASSRTTIGIAGKSIAQGARALPILNRPDATNQDVAAATNDLDGILRNGAPTDAGIHSVEYDTLASRWANLKTLLLSKPQAVATPEIKQHISSIIQDLNDVNRRTIKDNNDYAESSMSGLIAQHPEEWQKMRYITEHLGLNADQPGAQGSPTLKPLKNSGKAPTMRWNAQTGKVEAIP